MNPEKLGPYRIVRQLGRGGMGVVYEGVHVDTDERAAVKVLSDALAHESDFRQRFESEIEALRKLYHPNIVQLFGFGEQEGMLFYAMELVEGKSLEAELQSGRQFDWREVAQLGIEICRALRHAHDRGIVHRDIKPANLLLAPDGRVKLSDFGIARLFGNVRVTMAGHIVGTLEYMAPEQAQGRPPTPRGDLYSLGAVLYALLARRPPFRIRTVAELLAGNRPPKPEPLADRASGVPAEFAAIIEQLLERDPERRVANATLVARQLQAMIHALAATAIRQEEAPAAGGAADGAADGGGGGDPGEQPTAARPVTPPPGNHPTGWQYAVTKVDSKALAAAAAGGSASTPEAASDTPPGPPATASAAARFVKVDKTDRDREEPQPRHALISPQTWILAGALLTLGLGVLYFLKPPSAEKLYERIKAAGSSREALLEVEPSVHQFLALYPDDSDAERLKEVKRLDREIDLYRRQRQFERRARGDFDAFTVLPIERAYLEAMSTAGANPESAVRKLQAMINLYREESGKPGPAGQCLELADRELRRLQAELERSSATWREELNQRLARADALQAGDPQRARAMYQAIVDLFGERPWAAEEVERARKALNTPP